MADQDDYESLPESAPFKAVATAGACAGIAEHCAMYPFDSVKTRMQSLVCEKMQSQAGVMKMMKNMVAEEGLFSLWRGAPAMVAGAGPAHVMYFGALEFGKNLAQKSKSPVLHDNKFLVDGSSAVIATILHDGVMTPAEVVKQRRQMCCSPFASSYSCANYVKKTEGLSAFYRSYTTALSMNIPFQITMVMTYGWFQRSFNPEKQYNPTIHACAGAFAGGVASVVTMPWDVCKTLLNTQEPGVLNKIGQTEVRGLMNAAYIVWKTNRITGFYKGLTPRVLYQAPSTAISWSVYEGFKHLWMKNLCDDSDKQNDPYETLSTMMTPNSRNFQNGQVGSRVSHLTSGGSNSSNSEEINQSRWHHVTPVVTAAR